MIERKQDTQYMTDDIESDSDEAPSAPPPGRSSCLRWPVHMRAVCDAQPRGVLGCVRERGCERGCLTRQVVWWLAGADEPKRKPDSLNPKPYTGCRMPKSTVEKAARYGRHAAGANSQGSASAKGGKGDSDNDSGKEEGEGEQETHEEAGARRRDKGCSGPGTRGVWKPEEMRGKKEKQSAGACTVHVFSHGMRLDTAMHADARRCT
jgi:hypothetical protein